jgi:hypothetical protein
MGTAPGQHRGAARPTPERVAGNRQRPEASSRSGSAATAKSYAIHREALSACVPRGTSAAPERPRVSKSSSCARDAEDGSQAYASASANTSAMCRARTGAKCSI